MTTNNSTSINPSVQHKRTVYGVGYNSKGNHARSVDGAATYAYNTWKNMLERCYSARLQKKYPTYIGCLVDSRWHDYQVFAEWIKNNEHYGLGYHLDKDVLVKGNKIYSPETSCLIPKEINKLLNDRGGARGELPIGVYFNKHRRKIQAQISIDGRTVSLGVFDCADAAHEAYIKRKEAYVKEKALEWKDRIAPNVFKSLLKWSFND